MRFIVNVDTNWQVTITGPDDVPICPPRQLQRVDDDTYGAFPLPPADELPADSQSHCALCAADDSEPILDIYERIVVYREPELGDVETFGRYLFDTLIGCQAWSAIEEKAAQAEIIELALSFPLSEITLQRLNWEMMCRPPCCLPENRRHDQYGFLVDGYPKPIAISRLVPTAKQSARPLNLPPRVLFVIGTELTDPRIRAGAEYFGLLRQLKHTNRTINSRVLQQATPTKVKEIMQDFRPDVVYFICHGHMDQGGGYLELRAEGRNGTLRRYGPELLNHDLIVENKYPSMVVLSACFSGTILGVNQMGPLAAQLVAGGVPVVVGMAGRVSDLACQLFTRGFGKALVGGEYLVTATAEGRTAALYHGQAVHESVDWAFPTLFMAAGVESDYKPCQVHDPDPSQVIENHIKGYNLNLYDVNSEPAFCARHDFFDDYYDLFSEQSHIAVLGVYTKSQQSGLGRTRLLHEFTAQAVRDGHVPCLVTEIPTNLRELATKVVEGIEQAREAFNLADLPNDSQLDLLSFESIENLKNHPDLDHRIRKQLKLHNVITPKAVQIAIQKNMTKLIQDAYAKHPTIKEAGGRALILLDEIDQYGEELTNALMDDMLNGFGLGTSEHPIPVILTFSNVGGPRHMLDQFVQGQKSKAWLKLRALEPFRQENEEDMLAYKRVLLHPYKHNKRALAFNNSNEAKLQEWKNNFRKYFKGEPGLFSNRILITVVTDWAKKEKFLIEANDEDLLKAMREARK